MRISDCSSDVCSSDLESKRGPEPEPKPNDSTAPGAWLRRPLALFDHSVQAVGIQGRLSILDALPQVFQGMAQFANPFFLAGGMIDKLVHPANQRVAVVLVDGVRGEAFGENGRGSGRGRRGKY